MTDKWTDRLSDYLNGDLADEEHRALEAHLAHCEACRTTLEDLRGVVSWAKSHPGIAPAKDVWPEVSVAIRRAAPRQRHLDGVQLPRRSAWWPTTFPQALAAGIVIAVVAAGSWWIGRQMVPAFVDGGAVSEAWRPATGPSTQSTILTAQKYSAAIAELERALIANGGRIDTTTVRIVKDKLAVVDRAIDEARAALAQDPNSEYLTKHFANMMQRKLALLRHVARS